MNITQFHGSYLPEDVTFLLKPLQSVNNLPSQEKEKMIQSGQLHYSEMLNVESLPSPEYMKLFKQALIDNGSRMAKDCLALAHNIADNFEQPILVSLARAGTPVGVVLKHLVADIKSQTCNEQPDNTADTAHKISIAHYSISIIRDRGIDTNALDFILKQHDSDGSNLVFIDGWTGKGVITQELTQAVEQYNTNKNTSVSPHLYVLSDLAGVAWQSASFEDYLIPSAILNSTVSGLVSRSVLDHQITENDFHGCVFYTEFLENDMSQWFVKELLQRANELTVELVIPNSDSKAQQKIQMAQFIQEISDEFNISDVNLIKPGIGEATRVLLRRVPEKLIVQNLQDEEVKHLIVLAQEKSITIVERSTLPFRAVSIIKSSV